VRPFLDDVEHAVVDLASGIAETRVMEDTHAVVKYLVYRDIRMVPCVNHTGCNVLEDGHGDLTSRLVKDVGEMVLGQHAVGGIGGVRVGPNLVLMFRGRVDDCRRSLLELCGCLFDDRQDEGR